MGQPGLAAAVALFVSACVYTQVTPLAPQRPSRPEGCFLDLFQGKAQPPYPATLIARARTECDPVRRNTCTEQLRSAACKAGADAIVGMTESLFEYTMFVDATFVAKDVPPPEPAARPAESACEPICSPGFACEAGQCLPQCNPPCAAGEICNRKRLCEPAAAPTQ